MLPYYNHQLFQNNGEVIEIALQPEILSALNDRMSALLTTLLVHSQSKYTNIWRARMKSTLGYLECKTMDLKLICFLNKHVSSFFFHSLPMQLPKLLDLLNKGDKLYLFYAILIAN